MPDLGNAGFDRERHVLRRQLQIGVLVLIGLAAIAMVYYMAWEDFTPVDAIYMVAISISTVGYGIPHDRTLSPQGELFTAFFLVGGVLTLAWVGRTLAILVVREQVADPWGQRRRRRALQALKDHYILCGYGRMGQEITREFVQHKAPYVVIEPNEQVCGVLREAGIGYVQGDATRDEVLLEAGIERARGLVTVATSDEDNLFITLSARLLSPRIPVVARCASEENEQKLVKAGATRVISPYVIGGRRIAHAILTPVVIDFLDTIMTRENIELEMQDISVSDGSSLAGAVLETCGVRQQPGAVVVAMRTAEGKFVPSPGPSTPLQPGDVLIALGTHEQLEQMRKTAQSKRQGE